ncbi:MAG TPA: HEAT repeat domain-containing protein [Candidatus Angelobacter sp.]|nr:HEAT repeat domain-containing protein [Candidatus Angelobacter sp.]
MEPIPGTRRFCLAFILVILTTPGFSQSFNPVSVALQKHKASAGEPIFVRVHVNNMGPEALEFDLGLNGRENILISVVDPSGKRSEKSGTEPRQGMALFGWMRLAPGEEQFTTLVLNEWFNFELPGQYQITLAFKQPATVGGKKVPVPPFTLALDITPRNEEQLTATCENLVKEFEGAASSDERAATPAALRHIRDPKLVPLWKRTLTSVNQEIREIGISNLAHIRNHDAIEALSRALRSENQETRSLARSALQQITIITSDPSIKKDAENALHQPE